MSESNKSRLKLIFQTTFPYIYIYTDITAKEGAKKLDGTLMKDTDVAQGVEQIVYEVLLEMGKEGLITGKITNKNRPVNPAKESKKEEEQLV